MRQTIINIKCDVCGKEIDTTHPVSMGLISLAKIVTRLNMTDKNIIGKMPELNTKKEMVDISIDLCDECVDKIEQYINSIKKI